MGRPRKSHASSRAKPTPEQIAVLQDEIEGSGERVKGDFKQWLKAKSERELWFFSRWILGNDLLSQGTFHRREVCTFLTRFTSNRFKLLMLPMGHLKTTIASRSLPLHVLIQPQERNLYVSGIRGCNMRVLLANENEQKSKENLDVLKRHLESNQWLYWLWPEVVWDDPQKQSPRWSDTQLEVRRTSIWAEASIAAVGIKTGFIGKYFDVIVGDDICGLEASQNPPLMERAKKWRRSAKTRFYDKLRGIYIGVGTHWGSSDVYVEWKKDPDTEVMIKSIVETKHDGKERPLWPEKFPLDVIDKLRHGTDPIEFALWYMNKPVPAGYTALNWDDLREWKIQPGSGGRELVFEESIIDQRINQRFEEKSRNMGFRLNTVGGMVMQGKFRTKRPKDMDEGFWDYIREKYPDRLPHADN